MTSPKKFLQNTLFFHWCFLLLKDKIWTKSVYKFFVLSMLHVFVSWGEWTLGTNNRWSFAVDEEKCGKLMALEPNTDIYWWTQNNDNIYEISDKNCSVVLSFLSGKMIKMNSPVFFLLIYPIGRSGQLRRNIFNTIEWTDYHTA